jgi:hypothetical protein
VATDGFVIHASQALNLALTRAVLQECLNRRSYMRFQENSLAQNLGCRLHVAASTASDETAQIRRRLIRRLSNGRAVLWQLSAETVDHLL